MGRSFQYCAKPFGRLPKVINEDSQVINELRKENSPVAENIADHIESFTDYDFAHLLFSDGSITQSISLDKQLNIIQVADLVLPDAETTFEEYTTMELLSVSMLIVISTFALDFIHSNRKSSRLWTWMRLGVFFKWLKERPFQISSFVLVGP